MVAAAKNADADHGILNRVRRRFLAAMNEPIANLDNRGKAKMARRLERLTRATIDRLDGPIGAALYTATLWLNDLIADGVLILSPGSSSDRAFDEFTDYVESRDGAARHLRAVEQTSRDQAARIKSILRAQGLYAGGGA